MIPDSAILHSLILLTLSRSEHALPSFADNLLLTICFCMALIHCIMVQRVIKEMKIHMFYVFLLLSTNHFIFMHDWLMMTTHGLTEESYNNRSFTNEKSYVYILRKFIFIFRLNQNLIIESQ